MVANIHVGGGVSGGAVLNPLSQLRIVRSLNLLPNLSFS